MTGDSARWILVVDDSENAASTLEIALMGIPGLSIVLASSGMEALGVLDREGRAAHAIVTDLNMPRMDGYELIRRLRQDGRHRATPIIVVSADTDPTTSQRVAELGVAAFFSKPYSPAEIRRKVEQILDGKVH